MPIPGGFVAIGEGWMLTVPVMVNSNAPWYDFGLYPGSVYTAISPRLIEEQELRPTERYTRILDPQSGRFANVRQYRIESLVLPGTDDRVTGRSYVYAIRLDWHDRVLDALGIDGLIGVQWLRQEFSQLEFGAIGSSAPRVELSR